MKKEEKSKKKKQVSRKTCVEKLSQDSEKWKKSRLAAFLENEAENRIREKNNFNLF